mmetsp:Transcript_3633/g.7960  ORF Transcript_3633/g.7960 Transcript_3633/m.7960 type:complete len:131 (-) Transcript_3633:751-1143(-)
MKRRGDLFMLLWVQSPRDSSDAMVLSTEASARSKYTPMIWHLGLHISLPAGCVLGLKLQQLRHLLGGEEVAVAESLKVAFVKSMEAFEHRQLMEMHSSDRLRSAGHWARRGMAGRRRCESRALFSTPSGS